MIECVEQPMIVYDRKTGVKRRITRNLQGLTTFSGFRVVNIVSNGRLTKNYISLAEMENDDERLDWNPEYFPGLEQILTKDDVPFTHSARASMTIFDSGKGVGMGVRSTEDCYLAYQYAVNKALKYPDMKYIPKNSSNRFLYRQEQKRLYNLVSRQKSFDWKKAGRPSSSEGMSNVAPTTTRAEQHLGFPNKSTPGGAPAVKKTRKRKVTGHSAGKRKVPTEAEVDHQNVNVQQQQQQQVVSQPAQVEEDPVTRLVNEFLFGSTLLHKESSITNKNTNFYKNTEDDFDSWLEQFDVT